MVERWSLKPVVTGSNPVTPSMEKYKLIGDVMLSFIFEGEQHDVIVGAKEGGTLERNGNTVWYVTPDGERYESITTANVIEVALKRNDIDEI